jgi:hypothetical protein
MRRLELMKGFKCRIEEEEEEFTMKAQKNSSCVVLLFP